MGRTFVQSRSGWLRSDARWSVAECSTAELVAVCSTAFLHLLACCLPLSLDRERRHCDYIFEFGFVCYVVVRTQAHQQGWAYTSVCLVCIQWGCPHAVPNMCWRLFCAKSHEVPIRTSWHHYIAWLSPEPVVFDHISGWGVCSVAGLGAQHVVLLVCLGTDLVVHVAGQGSCFVDASFLLSFSSVHVKSRYAVVSVSCLVQAMVTNVALSGMWPQFLESCETMRIQTCIGFVCVCG